MRNTTAVKVENINHHLNIDCKWFIPRGVAGVWGNKRIHSWQTSRSLKLCEVQMGKGGSSGSLKVVLLYCSHGASFCRDQESWSHCGSTPHGWSAAVGHTWQDLSPFLLKWMSTRSKWSKLLVTRRAFVEFPSSFWTPFVPKSMSALTGCNSLHGTWIHPHHDQIFSACLISFRHRWGTGKLFDCVFERFTLSVRAPMCKQEVNTSDPGFFFLYSMHKIVCCSLNNTAWEGARKWLGKGRHFSQTTCQANHLPIIVYHRLT